MKNNILYNKLINNISSSIYKVINEEYFKITNITSNNKIIDRSIKNYFIDDIYDLFITYSNFSDEGLTKLQIIKNDDNIEVFYKSSWKPAVDDTDKLIGIYIENNIIVYLLYRTIHLTVLLGSLFLIKLAELYPNSYKIKFVINSVRSNKIYIGNVELENHFCINDNNYKILSLLNIEFYNKKDKKLILSNKPNFIINNLAVNSDNPAELLNNFLYTFENNSKYILLLDEKFTIQVLNLSQNNKLYFKSYSNRNNIILLGYTMWLYDNDKVLFDEYTTLENPGNYLLYPNIMKTLFKNDWLNIYYQNYKLKYCSNL